MPPNHGYGVLHCISSFIFFSTVIVIALMVKASLAIAASASASTLALGGILTTKDSDGLFSPTGAFKLCFFPADSKTYYLGVLYNNLNGNQSSSPYSDTAPAWVAGGNELRVGQSASLHLGNDGNLILFDDSTAVWNSSTSGIGVVSARMLDSGNFVLLSISEDIIWQSFDSPTHTLVMDQHLRSGMSLSAGFYTAAIDSSGELHLTFVKHDGTFSYVYWSSLTNSSGSSSSGYYLSLHDKALGIFPQGSDSEPIQKWYSEDYTDSGTIIRRLTLDDDGNLKIYSWTVGVSSEWTVGWKAVDDQCLVYGFCGPNSLCTYNSSGFMCTCAEEAGYYFIDESNPRHGCRSNLQYIESSDQLQCKNSTTAASMVQVNNTLLLITPDGHSYRYGDSLCGQKCLDSSNCIAATALNDGSGMCRWVMASDTTTFSGYQELSISTLTYFKSCGFLLPQQAGTQQRIVKKDSAMSSTVRLLVASVLITLSMVAVVQGTLWYCCCRSYRKLGSYYSSHYDLLEYASGAPAQMSYRELRASTQNFKEKLGEGGFGAVYKGAVVASGRGMKVDVAVKRLEGVEQGERQFRMEVAIIGNTHHMNLVRLCGFCAEGKHRLLVYEFMVNGSLNTFLFNENNQEGRVASPMNLLHSPSPKSAAVLGRFSPIRTPDRHSQTLEWNTRFHILLGAARGITYLHQECRDCIIHCDIKPENILLDEHFNAKVSDFGLAKLLSKAGTAQLPRNAQAVTNLIRGTRGYLAPEWRSNLPITVKSDVYSYGVVVLETISGRKVFMPSDSVSKRSFCEWAYYQYFHNQQFDGVLDQRMKMETVDLEELERAMKVAFWCLQVQPNLRPSMSRIIQMLEGTFPVDSPPMPVSFGDAATMDAVAEEDDVSAFDGNGFIQLAFEQARDSS